MLISMGVVPLVKMSLDGMTVMERTIIAIGTGATLKIIVVTTEMTLKIIGTRRILHAVLVVAVPLMLLVTMSVDGMTVMDRIIIAIGTRFKMLELSWEISMQTLSTRRKLHAVLVVAVFFNACRNANTCRDQFTLGGDNVLGQD
jgi:hypothetical protein